MQTILKILIAGLAIIIGFLLGAQSSRAEAPNVILSDKPIQEVITHFAKEYNQDPQVLLTVAKCESNFRGDVYGDGGRAYGVFQFHKPTFEGYEKQYGEDLDYYSAYDQAKLASWMFSKNGENHWTCFKMHYE